MTGGAGTLGTGTGGAAVQTIWNPLLTNTVPNTNTQGTGTATDGMSFQYFLEDSSDTDGSGGALSPYQGGQNYDAEFLGVGTDGTQLYIAIVTGQTTGNSATDFLPGDIRIETSIGTFGIEVTGKTYALNANGSRASESAGGTAGTIYSAPDSTDWLTNVEAGMTLGSAYTSNLQLDHTSGLTTAGTAAFVYNSISGSEHAIIEVAIDLSVFGAGVVIYSVSWGPSCYNDYVQVTDLNIITPPEEGPDVPLPATLPMFLLGLAGIGGAQAFRKRQST